MTFLLEKHHAPTYGFFCGLILVSVVVPYQMLKRKSWKELVSGLLAVALIVLLSNSLTEQEKIEVAKQKQMRKVAAFKEQARQAEQRAIPTRKYKSTNMI